MGGELRSARARAPESGSGRPRRRGAVAARRPRATRHEHSLQPGVAESLEALALLAADHESFEEAARLLGRGGRGPGTDPARPLGDPAGGARRAGRADRPRDRRRRAPAGVGRRRGARRRLGGRLRVPGAGRAQASVGGLGESHAHRGTGRGARGRGPDQPADRPTALHRAAPSRPTSRTCSPRSASRPEPSWPRKRSGPGSANLKDGPDGPRWLARTFGIHRADWLPCLRPRARPPDYDESSARRDHQASAAVIALSASWMPSPTSPAVAAQCKGTRARAPGSQRCSSRVSGSGAVPS